MKQMTVAGTYCAQTNIGKVRLTNEDRVAALINSQGNVLLIVCDGMGGQNKGEYAATIAINFLSESFKSKDRFLTHTSAYRWLYHAVKKANKLIYDESCTKDFYKGMGTTLTATLLLDDRVFTCQIGDSRAYSMKDKKLNQITEDQSYVAYLVRTHQITEEEAKVHEKRNVIMNALGIFPASNMDLRVHYEVPDTLLLCSDGLYNNLHSTDIAAVLNSTGSTIQKTEQLIALANANGGTDNISVVLWEAVKHAN